MSDQGWRRGDTAAWWDPDLRCWLYGTLTERHTVPSYVYEVAVDDGATVSIPERLLRSMHDPQVIIEETAVPVTPPVPRTNPPPRRAGASLADRFRG